jgi:Domain of unknown function (DUF222)
MPDPTPGPGRDDEQAASASGRHYLDWQALLDALAVGGFLGGDPDGPSSAAAEDGRMGPPLPPGAAGALAVEHMAPGPVQAGWLAAAAAEVGSLDEYALAGVAIAARQLASWALAAELSAVAQITARAAAADRSIGLQADGRPTRLCRDAVGQVSLALMLTDHAAAGWADLAITLCWRLPETGKALAAGAIDLARAKMIAEATSVLAEDAARAVEETVAPDAGRQTTAQLRVRLRRAVIAADPDAAERRREDAERHAKVSLYADEDGTATLAGTGLPAVQAAAAMARITAIARAMKAAGQGGGLDLHRARVMLGLLLGTLPYIPPPGGAPEPDPPPGGRDGPADDAPGPGPGHHPGSQDPGGHDPGSHDPGGDDPGPGPGGLGGRSPEQPAPGRSSGGGPWDDLPALRDEDVPADDGVDGDLSDGPDDSREEGEDDWPGAGPVPPWPGLGAIPPPPARTKPAGGGPAPGLLDLTVPWATLAGLSAVPGLLGRIGPITAAQARHLARAAETDPAAQWRIIVTNDAGQAIAVTRVRRRTRDGPAPARANPDLARARPGLARDGPPPGTGLVGRITLTITQHTLTSRQQATGPRPPARTTGPGPPAGTTELRPPAAITAAALHAAARALDTALAQARADAAAGGCAHHAHSDAYRPPPRLREQVTARDVTCRHPACRQPAWRADLDHTRPWENGGPTCSCNLGGTCRRHHQLKQHPRWKLRQTRPGHFTWTTPAGRTYTTSPDTHPV